MSGEIPAPQNSAVDVATKVTGWLSDFSKSVGKSMLVAEAPFFAWPVISQITDFYISKFAELFEKYILEFEVFTIIDLQEKKKLEEYKAAAEFLRAQLDDAEAERLFDEKFKDLVHFGDRP